MKNTLLIFAVLTIGTFAQASKLSCVNRGRANTPSQSDIRLEAQIISSLQLHNVVVTENGSNGGTSNDTATGRQSLCLASPDYNPRKFTNANQFILNLKGNPKNSYGSAISECQFILMLPKDLTSVQQNVHFVVPTLVHCDQNGGREDLNCVITSL